MVDNTDALQITNLDGLIQKLQGEEALALKNILCNFYTMNIKWETTTGHNQINT